MNKMKKFGWTAIIVTLFALTIYTTEEAEAQLSIGGSFELRDEDPSNGFGVRIEHGILQRLPILDLSIRGHFSLFSETIGEIGNVEAVSELRSYDFGLAALGGLNVGLVKPYVGLGLGRETFEITRPTLDEFLDDSGLFWNIFGGAELSILGPVRPFIEYRFTKLFDDDLFGGEIDYRQNGRLAVGVSISL